MTIGPAVRADFRRLYPANAKTPTYCPSDDNHIKVTNYVTSAPSLWWHVGPYFWPRGSDADGEPHSAQTIKEFHIKFDPLTLHRQGILESCPWWFEVCLVCVVHKYSTKETKATRGLHNVWLHYPWQEERLAQSHTCGTHTMNVVRHHMGSRYEVGCVTVWQSHKWIHINERDCGKAVISNMPYVELLNWLIGWLN